MALNPVVYTEKIVRSFLRYQLTAYPFSDLRLHTQMRALLSLDVTRQSPLLKGPFISLSRPFREGAAVDHLVAQGVFHPHMRDRIPSEITHVYGHQEEAVRAIHAGRTTLVSTGTGSGKSECFLYPIVSKCLELRDANAAPGISAVVVYPMNALAEDQLGRLRHLLAGSGITFGMYVGKTPEYERDVAGKRLKPGASRAEYEAELALARKENRAESIYPAEEVCSREMMRKPGNQPRILLTNVNQLELLLTRQRDVELFADARLDFLVFDEAHTFTGAQGAETACLIRRLRTFCGRQAQDTTCVATSATIADPAHPDAAREFASRFFGVPKADVVTVGESYEPLVWAKTRKTPAAPKKSASALLEAAVKAVDDDTDADAAVRAVYRDLMRADLPPGEWPQALHEALSQNEIVYQLTTLLEKPCSLGDLPAMLEQAVRRPVPEAEILTWLTLGAAARDDGRPLVRPVVHSFIRGIGGAVVTFPLSQSGPQLWLSAEEEAQAKTDLARFPVTTCTTCGQHYFVAHLRDFEYTAKVPGGGDADGDGAYWETLDDTLGGRRVLLVDRTIGEENDESLQESKRTTLLHVCRFCGAASLEAGAHCRGCGRAEPPVALYAIQQNKDNPGYLTSCLSCGASSRAVGTQYREPARPVRATNVADVHVLAQDMIAHSERPRLLVFCDNRQDAAFQSGWMKDHSRRFRLRALMAEGLANGPVSVGDLTLHIDRILEKDEVLSRILVPEVWRVVRREGGGGLHERERRKFLRIQVLREITLSTRQSLGLEPWGRMRVEYEGLDAAAPWIQKNAQRLALPADDLRDGVASVLDYLRRKRILHDAELEIYTHYWQDGDEEIQRGYLPKTGAPTGTKLVREPSEKTDLVDQWVSQRGDTVMRQVARKWGVDKDDIEPFLESLFEFLVDQKLLRPVTLKGAKGKALPDVSGVYQVDADRLRLRPNAGFYRCKDCRRRFTRRTPRNLCLSWRCDGALEFVGEDKDDYNLQMLEQRYTMIRPEEHTAMVPHDERERLENLFKGDSDVVNAFVCTPTLELGVDIGALDAVLMRNVPPLPANYWQRAGRAGRRHRMAVDVTYCRTVSHDQSYFTDPLKLLNGRVDPPSFNLRNELMVSKHVHATVITWLQQRARSTSLAEAEREHVRLTLAQCLPQRVSTYLFDGQDMRTAPLDVTPLQTLIVQHASDLLAYVEAAFQQGWPTADGAVVDRQALQGHLAAVGSSLEAVVARLWRRLRWAVEQVKRLNAIRDKQGTLESEDDALFKRCDQLVKRLKGVARRGRGDAEGYDDVNTFGVLAAEGFLPGYGLDSGTVLGTAQLPYGGAGSTELVLPRAPSVALREYVPGNLIYSNGNRFVARRFHRDIDESRAEMPRYEVSVEHVAVKETKAPAEAGGTVVEAISVCDVELVHMSHISDEEELRFQLGVAVHGIERNQHNGGRAYQWGGATLHHRRGVRMRLVNVGASRAIQGFNRFGYPVCTVCGQSVSPLSSERQRDDFEQKHLERCGRKVLPTAFYADVIADALTLPGCSDQETAYSLLEALRFSAARVLEMHPEDLQVLVIGHVDHGGFDGMLWDPMPGGSGLLDQLCERFEEIVAAATSLLHDCPSVCERSCVDCLQTFRNGFYHKHLNRRTALDEVEARGPSLSFTHDIPPLQPAATPGEKKHGVNDAEERLRHLLEAAGFGPGIRGEQIKLDQAIGSTTPDVIYRGPDHEPDEGVCIYLDGLSSHIHGNSETAAKDHLIRTWLRNNGYEVIELSVVDLDDEAAMTRCFKKLAGYLGDSGLKKQIADDTSWYARGTRAFAAGGRPALRLVKGEVSERYRTCVPFLPLKVAAGGFGDRTGLIDDDTRWVAVDGGRALNEGMFVAKVTGRSMEPKIPDGAHCLFRAYDGGPRDGRLLLVRLREEIDPETGERFTLKRFESEKAADDDGLWRHVRITLHPLNKAFAPIVLTCEDEGTVDVVAEFVEVIG